MTKLRFDVTFTVPVMSVMFAPLTFRFSLTTGVGAVASVFFVTSPETSWAWGIQIKQKRRRIGEVTVSIEHAYRNRVFLAVAEHSGERREGDAVRNEIQSLHSQNREPQKRIDAGGEDSRRYRRYSRRLAIDRDFGLAEACIAAALQLSRDIVRHAGVPASLMQARFTASLRSGTADSLCGDPFGWA
jgi:hypothetical protein